MIEMYPHLQKKMELTKAIVKEDQALDFVRRSVDVEEKSKGVKNDITKSKRITENNVERMAKKNWKHRIDHEFRGNHLLEPGQQIGSICNQKAGE